MTVRKLEKIYKEKQFLIFEFDDGKNVKYDFSINKSIGFSGNPVQSLTSYLPNLSIYRFEKLLADENYSRFIKFMRKKIVQSGHNVSNIGTILRLLSRYNNFEQIFSSGVKNVSLGFHYEFQDIPKFLIKLCREREVTLTNSLVKYYKDDPNAIVLAFSKDYITLTDKDVYDMISEYEYLGGAYFIDNRFSKFNLLISKYGYTAKALVNYIDELFTYEAFSSAGKLISEIYDYARMMKQISNKFDKYPRHFLTTHQIACRNYERLKKEFDDNRFLQIRDIDLEDEIDGFVFIYPSSTEEIKDEAVMQNNCVASYIDSVLNGYRHILFMRRIEEPDKSLVTIEVRNNQIVQARQRFNYDVTPRQQKAIDKWNKRHCYQHYQKELSA